jgi:predicted protein tyrosine phosphatase
VKSLVEDDASRKFKEAWKEFCFLYEEHRSYNITEQDKVEMKKICYKKDWSRIWKNKMFFSEYDIILYFSKILVEKFGNNWVHNDVPVDTMFFNEKGIFRIDIAIIDPSRYENGAELRESAKWNIFAEVKYISVGMWSGTYRVKRIKDRDIPYDLEKLQKYKPHYDHGYICIIDDQKALNISKQKDEGGTTQFLIWQPPKKVLFVCTGNYDRSPTAESMFRNVEGWEVKSAGVSPHAGVQLSRELVEWADVIFAMEERHKRAIVKLDRSAIGKTIVLGIPDEFYRDQPELKMLLKQKLASHISKF